MMNKVELANAALIAIAKTADKWSDRDELADGAAYRVACDVTGTVNDVPFRLPIATTLTVGHEQMRASSVTPGVPNIIAAILGKLNTRTRESVVQQILDEYAASGDISCDDHMLEMVDIFLAGLRQQKMTVARGPVKANPATKAAEIAVDAA